MRLVLDTNVLVSGLINPNGTPGQILQAAIDGRFEVWSSLHLWNEFERALAYPKVQEQFECNGVVALITETVTLLRALVLFAPETPPMQMWVAGDPADDWVVQCALDAQVEYIVSGDKLLQSLRQVKNVRIVIPSEFLSLIKTT